MEAVWKINASVEVYSGDLSNTNSRDLISKHLINKLDSNSKCNS